MITLFSFFHQIVTGAAALKGIVCVKILALKKKKTGVNVKSNWDVTTFRDFYERLC